MAEPRAASPPRCGSCEKELKAPEDVGWECDCGVRACPDPACFEDLFKTLAGGEATRCRACGLVT